MAKKKKTKPTPADTLSELKWAVKNRHKNQQCAIRLYELLARYREQIERGKHELFVQGLVSVTFSLWRAVFLAEKTEEENGPLDTAAEYLKTVISDNSITYQYDKKQREWTFRYYANNACYTLLHWSRQKSDLVPKWKFGKRSPKERWEYGHLLLVEILNRFEKKLQTMPPRTVRFTSRKV